MAISRRQKLIDALLHLAGPLGPMGSLAEREHARMQLHEQLDAEDCAILVDLLYQPPEEDACAPASTEDFQQEAVEALAAVARRAPKEWLERAERMLEQRGPNEGIIEILGDLGLPEAGRVLTWLVQTSTLTERELVAVACSLGEIGGPGSRETLEKMRSLVDDLDGDLARERWLPYETNRRSADAEKPFIYQIAESAALDPRGGLPKIHRCAMSTPPSTFALFRGFHGRAGEIANSWQRFRKCAVGVPGVAGGSQVLYFAASPN